MRSRVVATGRGVPMLLAAVLFATAMSAVSPALSIPPLPHPPPDRRPHECRTPGPYEVRHVTYPGAADRSIRLSATLTLPNGTGPFPAVVLVAGSGPLTRDAPFGEHRPFLVVADHLTRRGVAVLRADKRGVGDSGGDASTATLADHAQDVAGALDFLRREKGVDESRLGLLGHSEGAMVVPMAAALRPRAVSFVVLMAGPAVPGLPLLEEQGRLIGEAEGYSRAELDRARCLDRQLYQVALQDSPLVEKSQRARAILDAFRASACPGARLDVTASWTPSRLNVVLSPWFRAFAAFDPVPHLRALRCPALALYAQKDLQVSPAQNEAAMRAALGSSSVRTSTVKTLPGLNHMFQRAESGHPNEYGRLAEPIAREALDEVSGWIAEHGRAH